MRKRSCLKKVKKELSLLEMAEKTKNSIPGKGLLETLKQFPILGMLLNETMEKFLSTFQKKKRDELLNIIFDDAEIITFDMLNNVEFIMNFMKTLEAVNRLSSNDKVKYFANVLKNGYLSGCVLDNDEFDEYLFALSTLSYRQINILVDLYYHEKNNGKAMREDDGKEQNQLTVSGEIWGEFVDCVSSKYSLSVQEVRGILTSISRTGFCAEVVGTFFGYTGGVFYVTENCKKFIELISARNVGEKD